MANINRDYIVKVDVKTGKVVAPKNMKFKNTDKNTSNFYVQLVIKDTKGLPIILPIEVASDLTVKANVVKKNGTGQQVEATLVSEDDRLFEVKLPDTCINLSGTCKVEIEVSGNVGGNIETTISDSFTYTVDKSILSDMDSSLVDSSDYPVLKQLIDDINEAGGYKPKINVNGTLYDSANGVVTIPDYDAKPVTQDIKKELEDARVEADNTTHMTLGDRLNKVDSQIKEINDKLYNTEVYNFTSDSNILNNTEQDITSKTIPDDGVYKISYKNAVAKTSNNGIVEIKIHKNNTVMFQQSVRIDNLATNIHDVNICLNCNKNDIIKITLKNLINETISIVPSKMQLLIERVR